MALRVITGAATAAYLEEGGGHDHYFAKFAAAPRPARYQQVLPAGFLAEASKFYYDTATTSNAASMSAIRKLVPPSHIVFGTDFPSRGITDQAQALNASGVFTAAELDAINRGNAVALLPRLQGK